MAEIKTKCSNSKRINRTKVFIPNGYTLPRRSNIPHSFISNINPNNPLVLTMKTKYRLSSSVCSMNDLSNDRCSDSSHSVVERNFLSRSEVDLKNRNSNSLICQERESLHLTENIRECRICFNDQSLYLFEERHRMKCEHSRRTICDTCLYNHVKSHIENNRNNPIFCPEPSCQSELSFESINNILRIGNNLELFQRYDRQLTYQYLEKMKEFVWCAHLGCHSGQFHDQGRFSNSMMICIKCRRSTCTYHRTKWHIGMTCEEYQQTKRISIDPNTQLWLKEYSKKCPECQSSIEKISGCDHMTCQRCEYQFCWQCLADYRTIQTLGLRQHQIYCSHFPLHRPSNKNYSRRQRTNNCHLL